MNVSVKPVSVVMSVYNQAHLLQETLASIAAQTLADFELCVVNDGSTDPQVAEILDRWAAEDRRVRIIVKHNQGLTRALIDGCNAAAGLYIARVDVGDTMAPTRLEMQKRTLDEFDSCVFLSSAVGMYGPEWEPLWVHRPDWAPAGPANVVAPEPDAGLTADVAHHGSVMFRTSAYRAVGGYRCEFYFGQDWDLWYRLAEAGEYYVLPDELYRARIFPGAISMAHSRHQRAVAECSLNAHIARKRGESDAPFIARAAKIRPAGRGAPRASDLANGNYFIGEALRRAGNPGCAAYFKQAIKCAPRSVRAYLRLAQWKLGGRPGRSR